MIFALIAACAAAAVLAVVLSPLLTEARPARNRARSDFAIYRGRLAEIERDAARGLVEPGDADAARLEIERLILASGFASDAPEPSPPRRRLAALLALGAAAGACGLYFLTGLPGLPDLPFAGRAPEGTQNASAQSTIEGLAAGLQANPADADGWVTLGRAYAARGDDGKAAEAFEHARNLRPGDESIALAEAEALLSDRQPEEPLSDRVLALLKSIQLADPDQPLALWYLGYDAAQHGRFDEARQDWNRLLQEMPADAPERKTVNAALAAIAGKR
ncbi:MAG TPA: c-type cytochrome biogenesis protein CcmI [Stellaceae bacterium]|nr:c-type cytochrome biogenesis protein CcmI [Stellaceae bacterium]